GRRRRARGGRPGACPRPRAAPRRGHRRLPGAPGARGRSTHPRGDGDLRRRRGDRQAGLTPASPRDGAGRERGRVLIDRFLPEYDEVEQHEVAVDAPADRTYQAIKEIDLARSPVVLALLFARALPHLFTGAV